MIPSGQSRSWQLELGTWGSVLDVLEQTWVVRQEMVGQVK